MSFGARWLLLAVCLSTGCRPKADKDARAPADYFKTHFQDEAQFIVETIASDLAEQMFYAKSHRLPEAKSFAVAATEKSGSPSDAPIYQLQISLGPKPGAVMLDLNISGPIWSPEIYDPVATALANLIALPGGRAAEPEETVLLSRLSGGSAITIEQENERVSEALAKDFTNPALHEQAAVLLGAFMLREHSGYFFEIRSPLSRMTAHLAMARFCRGRGSYGINGRVAESMLLTLMNDQAAALEKLTAIATNEAAVVSTVRALQARNTHDYRPLEQRTGLSRIEEVEWFSAVSKSVGSPMVWPRLTEEQQQTIDFVRAANEESYSVEMGHQLLQLALPLELAEIRSVYRYAHKQRLDRDSLIKALNVMPERCFSRGPENQVQVRIIGWGQWAMFFQRHLCHSVRENFNFMQSKWGVPDAAKEFSADCEKEFGQLWLYPFVRRFNCTDEDSYHKAVDGAVKVTIGMPQLVPAECWNYLGYRAPFAKLYMPNNNPHISEWHRHNPPPGTAYNIRPRLDHRSLAALPETAARLDRLHELAPYDAPIAAYICKTKYNGHPTQDQAMILYAPVLPYAVYAMRTVADSLNDKPDQYEKIMLQAAGLNPAHYYVLGDYALNHQQDDKAAQYYDKGCDLDPDSVRAAGYSEWRVRYCLSKGLVDKARGIADTAGEVYSFVGLEAKAVFLEGTTNYEGAFEWFAKIEERYNNSLPVISFCLRYKSQTGSTRFDPEVQKRIDKIFPKGIEHVSLSDFRAPPADGVLIKQQNDRILSAGLKTGDVIVAVYGVRVHNFLQYVYGRDLQGTPELDLIVWQGNAYRELRPSPPNHLFGVEFGDYPAK